MSRNMRRRHLRANGISLERSLEDLLAISKSLADDLLAIAPDGHAITAADMQKTANFIAGKAAETMRANLKKAGNSASAADFLAKPIEAKVAAEVIAYLHAKAPLFSMQVSGHA